MSTPLKPIVKNDTLSLKLFGTSESSQEILVDAEDIVDEANPRDLSDLVELEEGLNLSSKLSLLTSRQSPKIQKIKPY